jgi:predicted lipoprotein
MPKKKPTDSSDFIKFGEIINQGDFNGLKTFFEAKDPHSQKKLLQEKDKRKK